MVGGLVIKAPILAPHVRAFLMEPASEVEKVLLNELNGALIRNNYDPLEDGFIEWGCVEHGVIHILAHAGQQWIEIDRKGTVTAL